MGDVEAAISLTQGRVIGKLRRAAATGTVGFGADQRALPTNTAALPSYWACCTWWPRVKPRYLLVIIIVGALAVAAGGLAGIVLGGQADCEVQKAEALAKFGYLVDKIHEQVGRCTPAALSESITCSLSKLSTCVPSIGLAMSELVARPRKISLPVYIALACMSPFAAAPRS